MEPEKSRRPTVWIVLTCVLAVAVVGVGIWALNAQSDADDAKAELKAQEEAASKATPAPTAATPAPTTAPTEAPAEHPQDPELQSAVDEAQKALGGILRARTS